MWERILWGVLAFWWAAWLGFMVREAGEPVPPAVDSGLMIEFLPVKPTRRVE